MKLDGIIGIAKRYCDISDQAKLLLEELRTNIPEQVLRTYPAETIRDVQKWLIGLTYASESFDSSFKDAQAMQLRLHEYLKKHE